MGSCVSVVWFKRDLRLVDHAVLTAASAAGAVLPLVIVEPEYWRLPDVSHRQYAFLVVARGDRQSLDPCAGPGGAALGAGAGGGVDRAAPVRRDPRPGAGSRSLGGAVGPDDGGTFAAPAARHRLGAAAGGAGGGRCSGGGVTRARAGRVAVRPGAGAGGGAGNARLVPRHEGRGLHKGDVVAGVG
ncbi:MAG: hypothetical protein B7Z59_06800 [Acidiphilium sp. 37-67-22]|nr:MAG: hypothetical protein B7Z59_06800 [Acidiphilium sp. 37-67-22]